MTKRLCLGLGLFIGLAGSANAELAMTGAPVSMRAGPSGKTAVVQHVPQRAEIDLERCTRSWCRASWRGRVGYIPQEAVVLGPPPATLPGNEMPPLFLNVQPTYATPPARQWTGPYIGVHGGVGSTSW